MVTRSKMVTCEAHIQDVLDRDYGHFGLKAIHSYGRRHIHPQKVVCVYTPTEYAKAGTDNYVFCIHFREWEVNHTAIEPIIAKRIATKNVSPKGYCGCGAQGVHTISSDGSDVEMCCRCYVRAGWPPFDGHPACMQEAAKKSTETVKLHPIAVNGEVVAYGAGVKNASLVSQSVYQMRGFFVGDFSVPSVHIGKEIEVEIPKQ